MRKQFYEFASAGYFFEQNDQKGEKRDAERQNDNSGSPCGKKGNQNIEQDHDDFRGAVFYFGNFNQSRDVSSVLPDGGSVLLLYGQFSQGL